MTLGHAGFLSQFVAHRAHTWAGLEGKNLRASPAARTFLAFRSLLFGVHKHPDHQTGPVEHSRVCPLTWECGGDFGYILKSECQGPDHPRVEEMQG